MHHFATEMCTFLLQNGALWDWCIVGCGTNELWGCEFVLFTWHYRSFVIIGSGDGLYVGTKPLPDPLVTWCSISSPDALTTYHKKIFKKSCFWNENHFIRLEGPEDPHLWNSRFGGQVTSITLQHLWPRPPGVWLGGPGCKLGHNGWS